MSSNHPESGLMVHLVLFKHSVFSDLFELVDNFLILDLKNSVFSYLFELIDNFQILDFKKKKVITTVAYDFLGHRPILLLLLWF